MINLDCTGKYRNEFGVERNERGREGYGGRGESFGLRWHPASTDDGRNAGLAVAVARRHRPRDGGRLPEKCQSGHHPLHRASAPSGYQGDPHALHGLHHQLWMNFSLRWTVNAGRSVLQVRGITNYPSNCLRFCFSFSSIHIFHF